MLNDLVQHEVCSIATSDGGSITGVYGGVETRHGDWAVLIRQGARTISVPLDTIQAAIAA